MIIQLINATSHPQDFNQWAEIGVIFAHEGRPMTERIDENAPLHVSVMAEYRRTLDAMDQAFASGFHFQGLLLGGYAPITIGLASQLRDTRHAIWVPVLKPGPDPEPGMRRAFVPGGVRWVRPAPFGGNSKDRYESDSYLHFAPRPLDGDRKGMIESLGCKIISAHKILPPPCGGDPRSEESALRAECMNAVGEAHAQKAGVLLDGAPAESCLHLWACCKELGVPLSFLRTEPRPAPLFSAPVRIERLHY